jgi:uncharacterized protein
VLESAGLDPDRDIDRQQLGVGESVQAVKDGASAEIEGGRYDGVNQPVKVVAVPNYLVVNRSMDPELTYRLTKLLFDQKEALAEVHPSARRLELATAPKVAPLELHPGAKRYYDEQART